MTIDDICVRCSKFSGWNLTWETKGGVLSIFDPKDRGKSQLCVSIRIPGVLHEVYGRLRHWAVTPEEQRVIAALLERAA